MKTLQWGLVMLFLCTISNTVTAQSGKVERTSMFRNTSDRLPAAISELEKAFTSKEGSIVDFKFRGMAFSGKIITSVKKYENLHSVIIESTTVKNTLLSISRRVNDDKTITYIGRILNQQATDGYELVENQDGTYTFNKILSEDLIQDF